MNSELIVKDVEFHGDILRAAQDSDGKFGLVFDGCARGWDLIMSA